MTGRAIMLILCTIAGAISAHTAYTDGDAFTAFAAGWLIRAAFAYAEQIATIRGW